MKRFPPLKTLGLATLVAVLTPAAAMAQIQTYYHAGLWDAFSGRDDKGGAAQRFVNTRSQTPWPSLMPRFSNFVSGRHSGRGA